MTRANYIIPTVKRLQPCTYDHESNAIRVITRIS